MKKIKNAIEFKTYLKIGFFESFFLAFFSNNDKVFFLENLTKHAKILHLELQSIQAQLNVMDAKMKLFPEQQTFCLLSQKPKKWVKNGQAN